MCTRTEDTCKRCLACVVTIVAAEDMYCSLLAFVAHLRSMHRARARSDFEMHPARDAYACAWYGCRWRRSRRRVLSSFVVALSPPGYERPTAQWNFNAQPIYYFIHTVHTQTHTHTSSPRIQYGNPMCVVVKYTHTHTHI